MFDHTTDQTLFPELSSFFTQPSNNAIGCSPNAAVDATLAKVFNDMLVESMLSFLAHEKVLQVDDFDSMLDRSFRAVFFGSTGCLASNLIDGMEMNGCTHHRDPFYSISDAMYTLTRTSRTLFNFIHDSIDHESILSFLQDVADDFGFEVSYEDEAC